MKKLVTVFAACAIAGLAMAVDSNIVGYITKTTDANKMDILGMSFQEIGGADLNVQDILLEGADPYGGTDILRVWNPQTAKYTYAIYFNDTYADYDYDPDLGPGWADADQIRFDFTIPAGQGFWLTTSGNASATIAGEVLAKTDNKVSTDANKMDILSNTFPVDANVQDVKFVSGADPYGGTDILRVWNPQTAKYTYAIYFHDTYADYDYDPDLGAGWADADQIRLDFSILAGQGFWLTTTGNAVVEFVAPAAL